MKKLILLLLSITAITISCEKSSNQEPAQNNIAYFPNTIGDNWQYKVFTIVDSLPFGTMKVKIIKDTILPNNDTAKVWTFDFGDIYNNPHSFDTNYVVSTEQLVKIYARPCREAFCINYPLAEKQRYILPLQVGNNWTWIYNPLAMPDTTRVLSTGTVTVPAGTFKNAYNLLKTRPNGPNYYTRNSIWLAPYIGVVELNQFELILGFGFGTGIWVLENYNVQ
jgi:hypothetical protein